MDFDLSEEQRLLKDSVERLAGDSYAFEARERIRRTAAGSSAEVWGTLAELGLLGLPFAGEHGGSEGGPVETMIVMEAFGRHLVLEPYLATVVMGGGIVRLAGSDAQKQAILPQIATGQMKLAMAVTERQSRYDLNDVATLARADGDGFVIEGEKGVVLNGDSADVIVVSARTSGARRDRGGISLFLVPATAAGVSRRSYETQDHMRGAEVSLSSVRVSKDALLGPPGGGLALLERIADEAIAAVAAEAVGAMDELTRITVDYLKTRKQFGVPIASFQVLQHRAVDMLVATEQARSMAALAAMMCTAPDAGERRKAVSAAKVQIGQSAKFVGQQAVQLHGGIAMTQEYKAGHYFKRLTMIDVFLGDADYHLELLADAGSLIEAVG